ncbi:MAG: GNAT family N-acetyltransferase [Deltaproteobacteria bacterium]|nr:GNAT family N-acetyltransferase [Deltaproteobacteria bacterium]
MAPRRSSDDEICGSDRVFLRQPRPADRERFIARMTASRKHLQPWIDPPTSVAAFYGHLKRNQDPRQLSTLIIRRSDDEIIGVITLSEIVRGIFQSGYLGYYLTADAAGQGYMTEAMTALFGYTFRLLELHRLEANIQPDNERSLALAQRLGLVKEGYSRRYLRIGGVWRDHERWAILAEDWAERAG